MAEWLPIADKSADGAILMAVLEHVQGADRTLSEAKRVLRIGGKLLVDVPFIQGYHAAPGDYRRFTERGLRAEIERYGFVVEESGVAVGPYLYTCSPTANDATLPRLSMLVGQGRRSGRVTVSSVCRP